MINLIAFAMNSLFAQVVEELNTSDVPSGDFEAVVDANGSVQVERSIAGKPIFVIFNNAGKQYALAPKTVRDIGAGSVPGLEATDKGFKILDGTKFWMSDDPYTKAGVEIPTIAPRGTASKNAV